MRGDAPNKMETQIGQIAFKIQSATMKTVKGKGGAKTNRFDKHTVN